MQDMRDMGYVFFITLLGTITIWWFYVLITQKYYDKGYWSGRNDGWRASLEHQERIRKMKSDQVFDYDKN